MNGVLSPQQIEKLTSRVDEPELTDLACQLVNIPSPTGYERKIGEFVANWFHAFVFMLPAPQP